MQHVLQRRQKEKKAWVIVSTLVGTDSMKKGPAVVWYRDYFKIFITHFYSLAVPEYRYIMQNYSPSEPSCVGQTWYHLKEFQSHGNKLSKTEGFRLIVSWHLLLPECQRPSPSFVTDILASLKKHLQVTWPLPTWQNLQWPASGLTQLVAASELMLWRASASISSNRLALLEKYPCFWSTEAPSAFWTFLNSDGLTLAWSNTSVTATADETQSTPGTLGRLTTAEEISANIDVFFLNFSQTLESPWTELTVAGWRLIGMSDDDSIDATMLVFFFFSFFLAVCINLPVGLRLLSFSPLVWKKKINILE